MATTGEVMRLAGESGLIPSQGRVLVLLSGGADSVCLTHVVRALAGSGRTGALHVNHGLRDTAERDERFCRSLCERLGIAFHAQRLTLPDSGNVEAEARGARYAAAEQLREQHGYELVASGHTASDQVETALYRLATSPGRRSLLGIAERRGRLVRPLLAVSAGQTRAYCGEAGLAWVEDETNRDTRYARNRIRHDLLPMLADIHPAAQENILATIAELAEESQLLEAAVDQAERAAGAGGTPPAVDAARLGELTPAVRRLLLRRLAEQAAGGRVAITATKMRELERLAARPGSSYLDLGGGLQAASEYGVIRFREAGQVASPPPARLSVPGSARFGSWEVSCSAVGEPQVALTALDGSDEALIDARAVGSSLEVRGWRDGDRIQPLGMSGSKSLQDLFTDLKIPRSLRHSLPLVVVDRQIAWVAGVAVSDRFKVTAETSVALRLRARVAT